MIAHDYLEKRNFIRMTINTPVQIHDEQQGGDISGICNDLSGNGMLLTVDQELPIESELLVTLCSPNHSGPSLQARCTIARHQPTADHQYLLGLEIQEIINEKAAKLM